jgi:drug/metabolite transporter (DMT)-like permease
MAVTLAMLAAVVFAFGTVLQQKGALQTTAGSDDPKFYLQLLKRPVWLLGIACNGLGALLQLAALDRGPLIVVQPILTLSLVVALPVGWWLTGQALGRTELFGALAVVSGIVVFLALGQPDGGIEDPAISSWVIGGALTLAVAAALTASSRDRPPAVTAGLLGAAAGTTFALSSSLAKFWTTFLGDGALALLAQWSTYALAIVALIGLALQQASLKVGVLPPAMATVNVANLIASVALGIGVFSETLSHGDGRLVFSLCGLAVTIAGVLMLMGIPLRRSLRSAQPRPIDISG